MNTLMPAPPKDRIPQKASLGKGLASLFPQAQPPHMMPGPAAEPMFGPGKETGREIARESGSGDRHQGISLASVEEIIANEYQPRREFEQAALLELADSIRANGIIQPLVVRKADKGYELIAGERRLRAAKLAGIKMVPVVIRKTTDREALEIALVENIQREDLNCIEQALAYLQMQEEFSMTQEQIAQRVGKDRASVANHLRLLKHPEPIMDDLRKGNLSFGHGKALLGIEDLARRLRVRTEILEKALSVRETENRVERLKTQGEAENDRSAEGVGTKSDAPVQSRMQNITRELSEYWETRVEIRGTEKKGRIVIHYHSREELERLLTKMHS